MSYRTPLNRVRGLGSAKEGVAHWWWQRMTALALVPLTLWFAVAVIGMIGADYETAREWLGRPAVAVAMIFLVAAGYYHLKLGVQVVVEDYVHGKIAKYTALVLLNFGSLILAVATIFAILAVAFEG